MDSRWEACRSYCLTLPNKNHEIGAHDIMTSGNTIGFLLLWRSLAQCEGAHVVRLQQLFHSDKAWQQVCSQGQSQQPDALLCRPFLLQAKASYTAIGIFSLASYPYSFKLLWSPLVDSIYSLAFGRRKSWVVRPCANPSHWFTGIDLDIEAGRTGRMCPCTC